ncbi:E3 ubiquitin-protein ligase CHFR-like [Lycorma delicatula]|uniref:E3 ubiquitin-protein ligase CHFR-like n=1 Tax=Lycorma delicatula TaxID=130591 RepID=UPI003F51ABC9
MQAVKRSLGKQNCAFLIYVNPRNQKETAAKISKPEFVIGRTSNCDLTIINPVISRKHCFFKCDENGMWSITDTSTSGTYVNKERILSNNPHALRDEDVITLTGPYSYPFHFYTGDVEEVFKRKKLKGKTNIPENANNELINVGGNFEGSNDVVFNTNNNKDDDFNKNLKPNDDDIPDIATQEEENNNSRTIQHLQENIQSLTDKLEQLKHQAASDDEKYRIKIAALTLEVQVLECRHKLNNDTIEGLKNELTMLKTSIIQKDHELKATASLLLAAKQNEVKHKDVEAEVLTKVSVDILDFLEAELQCSICSEIAVDTAVLSCTHLFCCFCIMKWIKKKKECAVCRTPVKEVIKSRAVDTFIEKILEKYSPDTLKHRRQLLEERKADKSASARLLPRHSRNGRASRFDRNRGGLVERVRQPRHTIFLQPDPEELPRLGEDAQYNDLLGAFVVHPPAYLNGVVDAPRRTRHSLRNGRRRAEPAAIAVATAAIPQDVPEDLSVIEIRDSPERE